MSLGRPLAGPPFTLDRLEGRRRRGRICGQARLMVGFELAKVVSGFVNTVAMAGRASRW